MAGLLIFAGFIWYAHSGNYALDLSTPLFPLRRDERGKAVRDRAVVMAVVVAGVSYAVLGLASPLFSTAVNLGWIALCAGIVTYFAASAWLFHAGH